MNADNWFGLLRGTNGRCSTNSWPVSPGNCIDRYSGSTGVRFDCSVVSSFAVVGAVTRSEVALSGAGAMSHNVFLRKKSLGSVMWYSVYCSVCARNRSSG